MGGGPVGERKTAKLLESGASVHIVARSLTPWLEEQCRRRTVQFIAEDYDASQMEGASLVFAATSDLALNRIIAADAHRRGLWCNMATEPESGSCIVPAVLRQGPLTIAISTDGLSPALARQIRQKLGSHFGPEWNAYLLFLGIFRNAVQKEELGTLENQRIFREIVELPIVEWIQDNQPDTALEAILQVCRQRLDKEEVSKIWNKAWKSFLSSSRSSVTSAE